LILQLKSQRVKTKDEPCYELKLKSESKEITLYRVYTRKLDRVLVTKCLSYIYLKNIYIICY